VLVFAPIKGIDVMIDRRKSWTSKPFAVLAAIFIALGIALLASGVRVKPASMTVTYYDSQGQLRMRKVPVTDSSEMGLERMMEPGGVLSNDPGVRQFRDNLKAAQQRAGKFNVRFYLMLASFVLGALFAYVAIAKSAGDEP
jgi:hypothetical protein